MHPCTGTGRTAHMRSRGIALLFLDHGTRRGWGVSVTPRPLFTPGKDPVPIVRETGWAPWPVWTGVKNLASTGNRSPDRPPRSQSLYRLLYPAHTQIYPSVLIRLQENIKHNATMVSEKQKTQQVGNTVRSATSVIRTKVMLSKLPFTSTLWWSIVIWCGASAELGPRSPHF